MPNPWLMLAVVLALAGAAAQGYRMGGNAAEARHSAALVAAQAVATRNAELASRKEAARLALQAERDQLQRNLEDIANEDPDAGRPAIGLGSVQRLNRR